MSSSESGDDLYGALAADINSPLPETAFGQSKTAPSPLAAKEPPEEDGIDHLMAMIDSGPEKEASEAESFVPFFKGDEPRVLGIDDLSMMLVWGANNGVSDTFVNSGVPLTMNQHGRLIHLMRRPLEISEVMHLIGKVRPNCEASLLAGNPVDTRYDFSPDRSRRYSYRVNATRGMDRGGGSDGIEIVFRTIPSQIPKLSDSDIEKEIVEAFFPKDGLILVVGVTGSGKSTLMATMIQHGLQTYDPRLLTYEAPPEFPLVTIPNMKGMVHQAEVGVHVSSFAEGVRNSLRRAPDWIMIGEARDEETIAMTIRAVETGHTVYSTAHTRGVLNTLDRMADEFPINARWSVTVKLINAMRLIIYQRLVRVPGGGRTALREFLVFTPKLRDRLIRAGQEGYGEILAQALREEGQSLMKAAEIKYAKGLVSDETMLEIRESSDMGA